VEVDLAAAISVVAEADLAVARHFIPVHEDSALDVLAIIIVGGCTSRHSSLFSCVPRIVNRLGWRARTAA
jgi:hypothetical protein